MGRLERPDAVETYFLERAGHPRLRYGLALPTGTARAAVLLTPGYMEHIGRYEHVAELWNAAGFAVAVHDPRGQGESGGRRGHILHFSEFVADIQALLHVLDERDEWRRLGPPILVGHSMGALISTEVALTMPGAFRGLAMMSPFFGIALKPPAWKVWVGRKVSRWWPTYTEQTGLSSQLLTHDPVRAASIDADPLTQSYPVTARWFTEMEAAHRDVKRRFLELNLPLFCLAAGDDRVADVNETRALFRAALAAGKQAELKVLADQYHELHQELLWRDYMQEFATKFETWS
jgi:alpha-beta hydrolase superfamily lysophospholipase